MDTPQDKKERIRATDEDLGAIQQSYTEYLKAKLNGDESVPDLSAADQTGIRNILKDNNITIAPVMKDAEGHRKTFSLTLLDKEVDNQDILNAAGVGT